MTPIPDQDVCRAAQRFADFLEIHGPNESLMPLFESVGADETTLVHMMQHCLKLGINNRAHVIHDGRSFVTHEH